MAAPWDPSIGDLEARKNTVLGVLLFLGIGGIVALLGMGFFFSESAKPTVASPDPGQAPKSPEPDAPSTAPRADAVQETPSPTKSSGGFELVELKDGSSFVGRRTAASGETIGFKTKSGKLRVVKKSDIRSIKSSE